MKIVDLETARHARGLRLVVLAHVPSPWSEAAKGLFHVKGIDFVAVRQDLRDQSTRAWTGIHNAPVAMYDDEAPRSHWSDILALAERLDQRTPLVPAGTLVHALGHDILGEGGLVWSGRLVLLHASLTSGGTRGFSLRAAQYLAEKYGYTPDRVPAARARVFEVLDQLAARLRAGPYLIGDSLTAADIYAATALATFAPMPDEQCPLLPQVRKMFDPAVEEMGNRLPPELLEHRERIYRRHLELPIAL